MVVTWQTVITAAAVLGAIAALLKYVSKGIKLVEKQSEQDEAIADIQTEQAILTYGILACLKGMKEQGADRPVTEAIDKIEKHLNEKAHKPKK